MKQIENITKSKIFLFFVFIILIKPGIFSEYSKFILVGNIFDILRIIVCVYVFLVFFINRLKINKSYLLMLYFIILFIPTIYNNGDIFGLLIQSLLTLIWIILFNYNMNYNKNNFLDALDFTFYLLIVINFITILLFPDGMYVNSSYYHSNYFLGLDNNFIMYILPGLTINFLNSYRKYNKLSKTSIILYLIILISVIKIWSVTTLCAFILLSILLFLSQIKNLSLLKFFKVLFILLGSCFILFLILDSVGIFKYLMDLFGKDVTLSNRVVIWKDYIYYIKKQPFIGYGYEKISTILTKTNAQHAHNIYLNIIYQGGYTLFLVFLSLIYYFSPSKRISNIKCVRVLKCIIVSLLFAYFFEAYPVLPMFFLILLFGFYVNEFDYNKV